MSHSCDDTYDIYDERTLRANKPHTCCACGIEIRKFDRYTRVFVLYDGRKEHFKRCARCQFLHEHLRTLAPGEMWPDEQLGCGTLYADEWGTPPGWVNELAFWRPGDPLPAIHSCDHEGAKPRRCRERRPFGDPLYYNRCMRREPGWQHWPSRTPLVCGSGTEVCS